MRPVSLSWIIARTPSGIRLKHFDNNTFPLLFWDFVNGFQSSVTYLYVDSFTWNNTTTGTWYGGSQW